MALRGQNPVKSVLFSFGVVDLDSDATYDPTADMGTIFPADFLQQETFNDTNCASNRTTPDVADFNTSWSIVENYTKPFLPRLATSFENCGTSIVLNETLNDTLATDPDPYLQFLQETVWSWGVGQPANYTVNEDTSENMFRCAVVNSTGRWAVSDCGARHVVACRIGNQPYNVSGCISATVVLNVANDHSSVDTKQGHWDVFSSGTILSSRKCL